MLFSVTAFHAVTSFYLEICAYFVKLQNGSELDADIEVFTPASVDTGSVEFYISDIFVHYLGQFITIIILAEKSAPAKNFHFFTKWSKKYITCTTRLQFHGYKLINLHSS